MDETLTKVWQLAEPLAARQGLEIIDIQFHREGSRTGRVLRLFLDKEGGPNMDDLSRVSRELSDLLDSQDVVDGHYTLEVSSPGINRPLKRPEHFPPFLGKRVRVQTREKISGRRAFLGILKSVHEDRIVIIQDGTEMQIPFSMMDRSNYEHDWSA